MKHILIYSFSFLLQINLVFSQVNKEVNDSIKIKKNNYPINIFLGLDFFSPTQSIWSKKNSIRAYMQFQSKEKLAYVIEAGYERNNFKNLNWNVNVNGLHTSLGFNYFLIVDKMENKLNGFYIGGRVSHAIYNQEIKAYPVYGNNTSELLFIGSLNETRINSTWVDLVFGGRVDLIKKRVYADISIRPKLHLYSTQQENIKPLVIPGFGNNQNNLNTDILFALAYQIKFKKVK